MKWSFGTVPNLILVSMNWYLSQCFASAFMTSLFGDDKTFSLNPQRYQMGTGFVFLHCRPKLKWCLVFLFVNFHPWLVYVREKMWNLYFCDNMLYIYTLYYSVMSMNVWEDMTQMVLYILKWFNDSAVGLAFKMIKCGRHFRFFFRLFMKYWLTKLTIHCQTCCGRWLVRVAWCSCGLEEFPPAAMCCKGKRAILLEAQFNVQNFINFRAWCQTNDVSTNSLNDLVVFKRLLVSQKWFCTKSITVIQA